MLQHYFIPVNEPICFSSCFVFIIILIKYRAYRLSCDYRALIKSICFDYTWMLTSLFLFRNINFGLLCCFNHGVCRNIHYLPGQGGMEYWSVDYTSPRSFKTNILSFIGFKTWGIFYQILIN